MRELVLRVRRRMGALGSGDDLLMARVTIATLRFADRGTIRVSAQAVVRQPSAISATSSNTA
jgi:hypothetical protein